MNIAVLGINYYPEVTGIGAYTTDMCEYLASKGHAVTAFTSFPYYPFGSDYSSWYKETKLKHGSLFYNEKINGVEVLRCSHYNPRKKPSVLKRFLHESSFILLMLIRTVFSRRRYDLIIYISPPFLLGLVTIIFSRIRKIPYILHVQDLVIDTAWVLGMIKSKSTISVLKNIEYYVYKNADFITTISESMRRKIVARGVGKEKTGLLINWVDTGKSAPADKNGFFLQKNGLNGKFIVLHAGNMGEKQDLDIILKAAGDIINDKSVLFLLVGRGGKRLAVERYIKRNNLTNVRLMDVQPKETIGDIYSSCDISLVTQNKKINDCVMPSKVLGTACAGKPMIVAARESCEICRLARAHDFGIVIPAGDAKALVAAIYRLREDRPLAESMGKNARRFMVAEHDREKILGSFERDIAIRYAPKRRCR